MPIANRSNLAQNSPDEAVIYVAKEGGCSRPWEFRKSCNLRQHQQKTGKVHLNRATESELQTVSGIDRNVPRTLSPIASAGSFSISG